MRSPWLDALAAARRRICPVPGGVAFCRHVPRMRQKPAATPPRTRPMLAACPCQHSARDFAAVAATGAVPRETVEPAAPARPWRMHLAHLVHADPTKKNAESPDKQPCAKRAHIDTATTPPPCPPPSACAARAVPDTPPATPRRRCERCWTRLRATPQQRQIKHDASKCALLRAEGSASGAGHAAGAVCDLSSRERC